MKAGQKQIVGGQHPRKDIRQVWAFTLFYILTTDFVLQIIILIVYKRQILKIHLSRQDLLISRKNLHGHKAWID